MKTEDLVLQLLKNIGEDLQREDLLETPKRVTKMYDEIFAGYQQNPQKILKKFDANGYDAIIIVKNIEYFSTCEHHMIPFFGMANVAYLPNKHITGLSKIPRLIDCFAKRLQNQERLTMQIANTLFQELKPRGVAVQITGKHLCMCGRGVKKTTSETVTNKFLGEFSQNPSLRADFLTQI